MNILNKESKDFTPEETKRLEEIHTEISKEIDKNSNKEDKNKITQLEKEKLSINSYVRASYTSDLLEVTETLYSLLKKVTTVTISRSEGDHRIKQIFTKEKKYTGAHTALAVATSTVYCALKLDKFITDFAGIKSARLVVEQGEDKDRDKYSVTNQAMNEFLLNNYSGDVENIKDEFTLNQLVDVFYSGELVIS